MVYRYADVPFKPYVEFLASPSGVNVLRDAPADHRHHHGLMLALGLEGIDFWAEQPDCGRQLHRGIGAVRSDRVQDLFRASFTERIDWIDPRNNKPLMQERRTIEVCYAEDLEASLLTWESHLSLPPGRSSVQIWGRPYFGLGMRFIQSMDRNGVFLNAAGNTKVEGTNGVRSNWCAYRAAADGQPLTVAMFDSPENDRHPATWYTLDELFAYLSCTMNLSKEPLILNTGKPRVLRYAVSVWDGEIGAARIEGLYRRWIGLPVGG
jgi:hypothetical protein